MHLTQANALDNLTSQFADQGLKSLQKYGKKLEKKRLKMQSFLKSRTRITLPDGKNKTQYIMAPIPELKGKFTKSMQEAYEKNIFI